MEETSMTAPNTVSGAIGNFVPPQGMEAALSNTTPELLAGDIASKAVAQMMGGAQPPQAQQPQPQQPQPQQDQQAQQAQQAQPQQAQPQQVSVTPITQTIEDRYADPAQVPQVPVIESLPEVPQAQEIAEPQNLAENAHHAFAASRAQAKQYRDLAERYRREVEGVRQQYEEYTKRESTLNEQLAAEQKRASELEEQIGRLDIQRSSAFRRKYDEPFLEKRAEITKLLVDNGVSREEASELSKSILTSSDGDIPDLISFLPTVVQGVVMVRRSEANQFWADRQQALQDWRTTQAGLPEVEARENAAVNAQRRAELADMAMQRIGRADTMQWNEPEYVKARDEAVEKAKAWYRNAPEDQIAAAAMEGALAPFAYQRVRELQGELDQLRQQFNAAMQARNPTIAPYYRSVPVVAPPPPPKPQAPGTLPGQPWATPVANTVSVGSIAEDMVRHAFHQR